jgi:hypothetical protein
VAIYIVGRGLWALVARRWMEVMPSEWRHHPELQGAFDVALEADARTLVGTPDWRVLRWLLGFVAVFAALWLAEFELRFQVLFTLGLSAAWAGSDFAQMRADSNATAARLALRPPGEAVRSAAGYRMALFIALFMVAAGCIGAACFLGGLIAEGLDG